MRSVLPGKPRPRLQAVSTGYWDGRQLTVGPESSEQQRNVINNSSFSVRHTLLAMHLSFLGLPISFYKLYTMRTIRFLTPWQLTRYLER